MKIDLFYDKKDKCTKFKLLEDVLIFLNDNGHKIGITIPTGFISDGASIPRIFWNISSPLDARYIKAFLKHDYCYERKLKTRKDIDIELKEDLIEAGMNRLLVQTIYKAVRRFGGPHWG